MLKMPWVELVNNSKVLRKTEATRKFIVQKLMGSIIRWEGCENLTFTRGKINSWNHPVNYVTSELMPEEK